MNPQKTTQESYSYEEILHNLWGLVDQTITKFADKEYIVTSKGRITYGDANHRANIICKEITSLNLSEKVGIGFFMKDPLKVVPAMIGTLKAGRYFIPLDITSPKPTLKSVVDGARIKILLTDNPNMTRAKALAGSEKIIINFDQLNLTETVPNPSVEYNPSDWVQILFTSGSTGKPKGAIEDYRYLANAISTKTTLYAYNPSDRIMDLANFTFSAAHTLVFSALLIGLTICYHNVKDDGFSTLANWIRQENITRYSSTVTIFRTWASTLKPTDKFSSVTSAHIGAEKKTPTDLETLKRHFPNIQFFRLGFASTETQALASRIVPVDHAFEENIPCGTPNDRASIFIWDKNGNALPPGEEGEIVAYGDTFARGYINDRERTKEKFIPDPNNPLFQYYKTGDLGKIQEDGQLVYLGRLDNMVKIKGVRIELNSIEKHILEYPGILQTAFKVFDDKKGNTKLTAYFIAEAGIQIPVSDLRKFLTERVPLHQIPHFFIQVDNFPLTRTGKLDSNQLPRPTMTRPHLSNPYVAPTTELESTLVHIWEEEVGIEGIGITDDFFEIGGDSLIGVVLFIRIEQELKRSLPVSTLLSASTIQAQAEIINKEASSGDFSPVIKVRPQGKHAPLFFIPGKGGYPTRIRHLEKVLDQETPIYALQDLTARKGFGTPRRIETIASFYLNEIKKIIPHGPYALIGESMGGMIALEVAQRFRDQGEEVTMLAMLDTYNFDKPGSSSSKVPAYLQMIIGKHITILLRSSWQGKLDYLKVYWDVIVEKMKQLFMSQSKNNLSNNLSKPPLEQNNTMAARLYQPGAYAGKVIMFKALRGLHTSHPTNGWDKVELGELIVHPIDCYHGSILFEPAVNQLAEILNDYIAKENN